MAGHRNEQPPETMSKRKIIIGALMLALLAWLVLVFVGEFLPV
jgi:hypothetical protein